MARFIYHYQKKNQSFNYYSNPLLKVPEGFRIEKEHYTYNNEMQGPSLYIYHKDKQLTKKVFYRGDTIATTTYYHYDEHGRLIKSERNYASGETALFKYVYDENNNLVSRQFFRADTLFGFENYIYNSRNILTIARFRNFDSWLNGTILFTHDKQGVIRKGEFIGDDGFNASIDLQYNENGLPKEITWHFSFGKFQRYTFQYKKL